MRRVILDLGWLNRMIHMKFTITMRTSTEKSAVRKFELNGDQYLRVAPYPNFVIEIKEPIEKQQIWTSNRSVSFDKFSIYRFVKYGKYLVNQIKQTADLYYFDESGILRLNKQLAEKIRNPIRLTFKTLLLVPSIVEDEGDHRLFEGVCMMINDPSNYAMMTIDEFEFLLDYMDKLNLDLTGLQLVNTYLLTRDMDLEEEKEETQAPLLKKAIVPGPGVEEQKPVPTKWRIAPESNTIPDL